MMSYGGVDLHLSSEDEAMQIAAKIPVADAFGFFRHRHTGDAFINPRIHFSWFLDRPIKLNAFFNPWGASRWGYALVLADGTMLDAIQKQNKSGNSLLFKIDDDLGKTISTQMYQLPAVPLAKIWTQSPVLPLWLVPLVDERYRLWERAAAISVTEGGGTWTDLYNSIATALGITLAVDPIPAAYLTPSAAFGRPYQSLPMLLDWVASSVGQRVVRKLSGAYYAMNPSTARALSISQANLYQKYAGGSLDLGVVVA